MNRKEENARHEAAVAAFLKQNSLTEEEIERTAVLFLEQEIKEEKEKHWASSPTVERMSTRRRPSKSRRHLLLIEIEKPQLTREQEIARDLSLFLKQSKDEDFGRLERRAAIASPSELVGFRIGRQLASCGF